MPKLLQGPKRGDRSAKVGHNLAVSPTFPIKDYSPVSSCGASTGLDCGEPFSLKKIDNTTMANTDKNSLC